MMKTCVVKPGWHPTSVGLMVLGFIVFWPLGLAMLAYILWGDRMRTTWMKMRPNMETVVREAGFRAPDFGRTGNAAFDDYRERELQRLEEERAKIERMRTDFDEFLRNLRRAKDQEEFDRFMASRTNPTG